MRSVNTFQDMGFVLPEIAAKLDLESIMGITAVVKWYYPEYLDWGEPDRGAGGWWGVYLVGSTCHARDRGNSRPLLGPEAE